MLDADRGFRRRRVSRNLLVLGADYGLFMIGLSFASQSTILPAFAASLGAPNVLIGAIPAVMTLGWFLPSLFAAGHTESLARKLPFVLRYTIGERAPFLVLAVTAFLLAERAPALALTVLLLMLLVTTGVGGALMPAWMDIVGHVVPTTMRGRFFAVSSVLSNVGGLLGSAATVSILAAVPPPHSYGICFLLATGFMALSWVALAWVEEPPGAPPSPPVPLGAYLRRIPGVLRQDRNLSWYLASRAVSGVGTMAAGFYTVFALRALEAPVWWAGVFTTVLLAGQIVGNLVLGWLADHGGHLMVLRIGAAAMVGANVAALAAATPETFSVVFGLAGVNLAAVHVSGLNVLLEFAPTPRDRPTYVGLGTTLLAPVMFAAPILAGLLVDAVGFRPVFVTAGVAGLIAVALFTLRVRDPRQIGGQISTASDGLGRD